jgi:choice-of-anchor A domain-containing protein
VLKRIFAVLTTALLTVGLTVGAALPASAHIPSVTATCTTLTVKFDAYGANSTNRLTVKVDSSVVENTTFGNSFAQKVYTFSGTVAHTYVIEVDAQDNGHDLLVAKGTAITGTTTPCTTATCSNPLTGLNGFTIVTEGSLTVSNGSAHAEGTAAVGGDLIVNNAYHVQNNHDGSALPVVSGVSTGLLVGGKITLNASGEAFQVNQGATKVGTTANGSTDATRFYTTAAKDRWVRMAANATLTDVAAPGLFASTFPSLFANLRASSTAISNYTAGDVNFVTTSANGGDGQKVTLSAGVVNVLRVNANQLSGITKLWFDGGVVPSASTPFVIDVTNGGNTTVAAPVLMNIDAHYVLWNFKSTTLTLSTTEFVKGSILAPDATLKLTSGGIEGQIAAKAMEITSGAEIHHIGYTACATQPTSVSGAATTTAESCDTTDYVVAQGTVTATAKTGVTYELWNASKTTKIADLDAGSPYSVDDGTYYVKVLPSSSAYTVSDANTWIQVVVGDYTGVCAEAVTGAATAAAEYCDTSVYEVRSGSVTATVKTGVVYELWNSAKTVKIADLTAGAPYVVAPGTYSVKVLPATATYTVAPGDTWIEVVVGDYTGLCAQGVAGSAQASGEYCDVDYDVKDGSVTANLATGVVYELWNAAKTSKITDLTAGTPYSVPHGTYFVKVLPATTKYTVTVDNTWIEVLVGDYTGLCAEPVSGSATPATEYCDVDYDVKQGSVTALAATGVVYELWNGGKTAKIADLTAGVPYAVDGGTYFVKVLPATSDYTVLAGDTWLEMIVGTYTGECDEPVTGSAATSAEYCSVTGDDVTLEKGSVTATAATGVAYELWNADKTVKIADLTADVAFAASGGTYFVKVLPATDDYTVLPLDEWIEVVVAANTEVCEVIGDPTWFEGCVVNPADLDDSDWTANLTIVAVDHVLYRVYFSDGVSWIDQGLWAPGLYDAGTAHLPFGTLVKIVAEPESGWSLLAPKEWTVPFALGYDCDLSTNGVVEPKVVFTQTCAAGPTYQLAIDGGLAGSVLWSVNAGPTTTQLGTFAAPAGSTVKIVATPAPGMGFTGSGQAALQRTFEKTFTSGAECDLETLAFTGQNATAALVIAALLLQLGMALVAVPFVRARRREA